MEFMAAKRINLANTMLSERGQINYKDRFN